MFEVLVNSTSTVCVNVDSLHDINRAFLTLTFMLSPINLILSVLLPAVSVCSVRKKADLYVVEARCSTRGDYLEVDSAWKSNPTEFDVKPDM